VEDLELIPWLGLDLVTLLLLTFSVFLCLTNSLYTYLELPSTPSDASLVILGEGPLDEFLTINLLMVGPTEDLF
jgi:hypothetical protein